MHAISATAGAPEFRVRGPKCSHATTALPWAAQRRILGARVKDMRIASTWAIKTVEIAVAHAFRLPTSGVQATIEPGLGG
eukprot:2935244-Karenia_brevis.AAC.1